MSPIIGYYKKLLFGCLAQIEAWLKEYERRWVGEVGRMSPAPCPVATRGDRDHGERRVRRGPD